MAPGKGPGCIRPQAPEYYYLKKQKQNKKNKGIIFEGANFDILALSEIWELEESYKLKTSCVCFNFKWNNMMQGYSKYSNELSTSSLTDSKVALRLACFNLLFMYYVFLYSPVIPF